MIPAPYRFASLQIHQAWLRAYRPLGELVVRNLSSDMTLYNRFCGATPRLVQVLHDQHVDLLTYLLHISTHLMYRLSIWWSMQAEEKGLTTHDILHGVQLPLPLEGIYDRALQSFIEGWEEVEIWEEDNNVPNAAEAWTKHSRYARLAAAQAEQTAQMILGAVARGDRTAVSWLIDSFLKWWSKHKPHFGNGYMPQSPLLTFACITKSWPEVKNLLDAVSEGLQESELASEVAALTLRRYWTDLRLTVILILLDWLPMDAPKDAFGLEVAIALLRERSLKQGGEVEADKLTNAGETFFRMFRTQLADDEYRHMLDKIVEDAQELRRPRMVAGRIYSRIGADDFESLGTAQAQLLTAICANQMQPGSGLSNATKRWAQNLHQLEQCQRFAQQLVEHLGSEAFDMRRTITAAMRGAVDLPNNLDDAHMWVSNAAQGLASLAATTHDDTLSAAVVSQAELTKVAHAVSAYVLGSDNKVFPFSLASRLEPVSDGPQTAHLNISGIGKAPYTAPPLEEDSPSRRALFNKHVAAAVANHVLSRYLNSIGIAALRDDSPTAFFEDLARQASVLCAKSLTPILLIPLQGGPSWAHPWRYQTQAMEKPANLSVRGRRPEDVPSVTGYFNDVEVHRTQLGKNCYVVAREHFEELCYMTDASDSCVWLTAVDEPQFKVKFRFEWAFAVKVL